MQSMMKKIDKMLQGQEKKLEDGLLVMQKVGKKVVTLERQHAQGNKAPQIQYQNKIHGSPPNKNYDNISFDHGRQNGHASTSSENQSKAIVPQNNMVEDQDFCPSYNYSYAYCMCQNPKSYLVSTT